MNNNMNNDDNKFTMVSMKMSMYEIQTRSYKFRSRKCTMHRYNVMALRRKGILTEIFFNSLSSKAHTCENYHVPFIWKRNGGKNSKNWCFTTVTLNMSEYFQCLQISRFKVFFSNRSNACDSAEKNHNTKDRSVWDGCAWYGTTLCQPILRNST